MCSCCVNIVKYFLLFKHSQLFVVPKPSQRVTKIIKELLKQTVTFQIQTPVSQGQALDMTHSLC